MSERIDLTYNLFFTIVAIPVLGYLIKSWMKEIKDGIKELATSAENRYEKFRSELDNHVTIRDFEKHEEEQKDEMVELWGRINKHCHDERGNVVLPKSAP